MDEHRVVDETGRRRQSNGRRGRCLCGWLLAAVLAAAGQAVLTLRQVDGVGRYRQRGGKMKDAASRAGFFSFAILEIIDL